MSNCEVDVLVFLIAVFILLNPHYSSQSIKNSNTTQQIVKRLAKELTVLYCGVCCGVASFVLVLVW